MGNVACNLCGNERHEVLYRAGVAQKHAILRCSQCGFMFADASEEAPEYVGIESWDPDEQLQMILRDETPRLKKEALQVRDYASTRHFLAERHPQRGKLLEIGSGLGFLLNYFREDGWDVLGVEPNRGMCRYAEKELQVVGIPAILPQSGVADASMQAVLMMHVIEHVPDPTDTMHDILRVLKPGGTLVMETPRYDSLMFKLLGRRERSLSCDGHVHFFTTKSLRALAVKSGFVVEREDYVGRSMTASRFLYNVGVVSKSKGLQAWLDRMSSSLNLDALRFSLNLRDMERIYLRKPA